MKRVLYILVLALAVLTVPTFAATPSGANGTSYHPPHPTPTPTPAPPMNLPLPMNEKDWTFAVFLNADNNLDPFGVEDMNEMSKVGSNDWLNVVTLTGREDGSRSYNYITKGNVGKFKDPGKVDMGDYHQLINFTQFIVTNFPAKHYAIVIWNHGSGWKKHDSIITRGISYDDSTG
ncbi:MAG: hypothetical protein HQM09_25195, partial [Candidatus Riflebacteria bacterium]|nr:hypothetical protein [Candidatus Riflebacteria bacterium]